MSVVEDAIPIPLDVMLHTHCLVEKFTFTWRISNFSKIFNSVLAVFFTKYKNNSWRIKLDERKRILLFRNFEGEPVNVHFDCSLKTCHESFESEMEYIFHTKDDFCELLNFLDESLGPHMTEFENDVLQFQCTMVIEGYTINNTIKSPDVEALPQISVDFKNLQNKKEYCDMTILVDNCMIRVHKAILCARSTVFNRMLQCDMQENKNREIKIDDIGFDTFQDLISFMYSGEVNNLSWDKAMKLYYAADKYAVLDLLPICSQFLQLHLTIDESCNVLELADRHNNDRLKRHVVYFIRQHASTVYLTDDWKDLTARRPELVNEVQINAFSNTEG